MPRKPQRDLSFSGGPSGNYLWSLDFSQYHEPRRIAINMSGMRVYIHLLAPTSKVVALLEVISADVGRRGGV